MDKKQSVICCSFCKTEESQKRKRKGEKPMELRHIRYFLTVADELNFTRAAEKLCIAQPPLSRQIQALEEELGVKLFLRKPHALHLTEEGEVFRQYAVQVLELVDRAAADVREREQGLTGTIDLATVEGYGPHLFAQWMAGFHKKNPHVGYNLWNGNSDDVANRIMKGLCDLAIITEPHNAEGVEALPVYREPWVAVLPPDHPLAESTGDEVELGALAPYELIIPSRKSRLQEIEGWFATIGLHPTVRCRIASMINAYELTEQGLGIAIFPASVGRIGIRRRSVVRRIVNPEVEATYILIWNKNRLLPKAAAEFLAYIQEQ